MRVRALSETGDMRFGQGAADFYVDQREAVGQKLKTRLGLYVGYWFLDLSAGMPWRTQVLGRRTDATRDPALRARILATQGVTSIASYASQLNRTTRAWSVQVTVNTAYGQTIVSTTSASPNGDVRAER